MGEVRFYHLTERPLDDAALVRTVGEIQTELGLAQPTPEAENEDLRSFRTWVAKAVAVVWGPLVPISLALWWWLR